MVHNWFSRSHHSIGLLILFLVIARLIWRWRNPVPEMPNDWVQTISQRYIELYEKVIGEKFVGEQLPGQETYNRIITALEKL